MKPLLVIFGVINEAWGLIFKLAIVVIAIAVVVGFVISCNANATLNEHSSCQQFEQADATTQDKVLQDMMNAHNDQGSLETTRLSVDLYCNLHDPNSPIDGVYSSGHVDQQSAQALHLSAPLLALAESRQAFRS